MAKPVLHTFDFQWNLVTEQDNMLLNNVPKNKGGSIYKYLKAFSYGTGYIAELFYHSSDKFYNMVEGEDFNTQEDKENGFGVKDFGDLMEKSDVLIKLVGSKTYRMWFYNVNVDVAKYGGKVHNGYADYLPNEKEFRFVMEKVFEDIMPSVCESLKELGVYKKVLDLYFKTVEPKITLYFVSYHDGVYDVSIAGEQTYNRFVKFEDMAEVYYKKYFTAKDKNER